MPASPPGPLPSELQRCHRCELFKPVAQFITRGGLHRKRCLECREAAGYRRNEMTDAERDAAKAARRRDFESAGAFRVRWVQKTLNSKTGEIPITMTERGSCPAACSLRGKGCYAEEHPFLRYYWELTSTEGLWWDQFLEKIEALPPDQLWRHNEAGDLPGDGDTISPGALFALAEANTGRRGFTFTHKPMTPTNAAAVRRAIALGFAINLSADSIAQADELVARAVAPVTVVLPRDWGDRATRTPAGNQLVVCPAQTTPGMTCERCRLCAVLDRKAIIGFRAHGRKERMVTELVRARRGPNDLAHAPRDRGGVDVARPKRGPGRPRKVRPEAPPAELPRPLPPVLRGPPRVPPPRAPMASDVSPLPYVDARRVREARAAAAVAAARARVSALLERGRAAVRAG